MSEGEGDSEGRNGGEGEVTKQADRQAGSNSIDRFPRFEQTRPSTDRPN